MSDEKKGGIMSLRNKKKGKQMPKISAPQPISEPPTASTATPAAFDDGGDNGAQSRAPKSDYNSDVSPMAQPSQPQPRGRQASVASTTASMVKKRYSTRLNGMPDVGVAPPMPALPPHMRPGKGGSRDMSDAASYAGSNVSSADSYVQRSAGGAPQQVKGHSNVKITVTAPVAGSRSKSRGQAPSDSAGPGTAKEALTPSTGATTADAQDETPATGTVSDRNLAASQPIDPTVFEDPNLNPEDYIKEHLADADKRGIDLHQFKLQKLLAGFQSQVQLQVYQNRTQFIRVSKEADALKTEMASLRSCMAQISSALSQAVQLNPPTDSQSLSVDRKRSNRSSVANLEAIWSTQLQTLWKRVDGAQKYLPAVPGRHVIYESNRWNELNAATWKPRRRAHLVLLNDHFLIAIEKKRNETLPNSSPNINSERRVSSFNTQFNQATLSAERCFPLLEVQMTEVPLDVNSTKKQDGRYPVTNAINIRVGNEYWTFATGQSAESAADKANCVTCFRKAQEDLRQQTASERGDKDRGLDDGIDDPSRRSSTRSSIGYGTSMDARVDRSSWRNMTLTDQDGKAQSMRWVESQTDGLDIDIALQRYDDAVEKTLQLKKLAANNRGNMAVQEVLMQKIDERADRLSMVLSKRLRTNHADMTKVRECTEWLKQLGATDIAVKDYLDSRTSAVDHRVEQLRFTGSIPRHIQDLSYVVFTMALHTYVSFTGCFSGNAFASAITKWIKQRVDDFNVRLSRELNGVNPADHVFTQCIDIAKDQAKVLEKVGFDLIDFVGLGVQGNAGAGLGAGGRSINDEAAAGYGVLSPTRSNAEDKSITSPTESEMDSPTGESEAATITPTSAIPSAYGSRSVSRLNSRARPPQSGQSMLGSETSSPADSQPQSAVSSEATGSRLSRISSQAASMGGDTHAARSKGLLSPSSTHGPRSAGSSAPPSIVTSHMASYDSHSPGATGSTTSSMQSRTPLTGVATDHRRDMRSPRTGVSQDSRGLLSPETALSDHRGGSQTSAGTGSPSSTRASSPRSVVSSQHSPHSSNATVTQSHQGLDSPRSATTQGSGHTIHSPAGSAATTQSHLDVSVPGTPQSQRSHLTNVTHDTNPNSPQSAVSRHSDISGHTSVSGGSPVTGTTHHGDDHSPRSAVSQDSHLTGSTTGTPQSGVSQHSFTTNRSRATGSESQHTSGTSTPTSATPHSAHTATATLRSPSTATPLTAGRPDAGNADLSLRPTKSNVSNSSGDPEHTDTGDHDEAEPIDHEKEGDRDWEDTHSNTDNSSRKSSIAQSMTGSNQGSGQSTPRAAAPISATTRSVRGPATAIDTNAVSSPVSTSSRSLASSRSGDVSAGSAGSGRSVASAVGARSARGFDSPVDQRNASASAVTARSINSPFNITNTMNAASPRSAGIRSDMQDVRSPNTPIEGARGPSSPALASTRPVLDNSNVLNSPAIGPDAISTNNINSPRSGVDFVNSPRNTNGPFSARPTGASSSPLNKVINSPIVERVGDVSATSSRSVTSLRNDQTSRSGSPRSVTSTVSDSNTSTLRSPGGLYNSRIANSISSSNETVRPSSPGQGSFNSPRTPNFPGRAVDGNNTASPTSVRSAANALNSRFAPGGTTSARPSTAGVSSPRSAGFVNPVNISGSDDQPPKSAGTPTGTRPLRPVGGAGMDAFSSTRPSGPDHSNDASDSMKE